MVYKYHIVKALDEVQRGQHLRFINYLFRTKDVCMAAILFQSLHTTEVFDIYSVPLGNLDYVIDNIEERLTDTVHDKLVLQYLKHAYSVRKQDEQKPGYYGNFPTLEAKMEHYNVHTFDELLEKLYYG